jgi:hypothetical protein
LTIHEYYCHCVTINMPVMGQDIVDYPQILLSLCNN